MVKLCDTLAQRALNSLPQKSMCVKEDVADKVYAAHVDWEQLIVRLDSQLQSSKIVAHLV